MRIGEFWLSQRRGSEKWCITWFDQRTRQTVRRSAGTGDLAEAEEALARHYIAHRRLNQEAPAAVAVGVLLDRYMDAVELKSTDTAKAAVRHWKAYWGQATVADLTTERQEAFIAGLKASGLSPGSIARVLGVGKSALNRAHQRQEIATLPALLRYQAPAAVATPRRALSVDELAQLWLAAQRLEHWRRYLWLAIGTGARPGALLDLEGSQVRDGLIYLAHPGIDYGKKRRPVLPMAKSLAAEVGKWESENLLVTWNGGRIARIRETFGRIAKEAGVDCTAYDVRHTVATWLRQENVPEWDVAGFMGHRGGGSATTERYAHYRPDYMRASAEAVEKLLRAVLRVSLRVSRERG